MTWDTAKYEAIALLLRRKTGKEIARKLGVSERTIDAWKAEPEFQAELDQQKNAWRDRVMSDGIADQQRRLYRLNDRWRRMQAVIEARATDETLKKVKGADTGLIVRTKVGPLGDVFAVDKGLLDQLLKHEEQAARETGQWNKKDKTGKHVIIVVPQAEPPSTGKTIDIPPEEPPLQLPGVVIDLAPQR